MTAPLKSGSVAPAPEATLVERLVVGTRLAIQTIGGRPMHRSEGMQMRAVAHGALAWRELMEGVLAGDAEAIAIARKAVAILPVPEPTPEKGSTP